MDSPPSADITVILKAWSGGDEEALGRLVPLIYQELKRLAHRYMRRETPDNTLRTTALVNEAYLRLINAKDVGWQDRAHFFAVAAQTMRRILVDAARARVREKRGGEQQIVNLNESVDAIVVRDSHLIGLDDALTALASIDPRKVKVIEMRFFGGLSVEETAAVLGISTQSVLRDWKLGRAWLTRELTR
ncbi:MAG TPA: sigma-70 family RNA polymerase sigma factor [Candidatus Sulfopaludibacter sp.]|jgi:RNA polymerase sigma factor (TIGR02999 family)|nr:sigma-70 family RNA polymerase sigma factor [Candidatus Sulfopaludibacter sp.]